MQSPCATKREQGKLARIVTALDRDAAQRPLHVCIHDRQHTLRRFLDADFASRCFTHLARQRCESRLRSRFIKLEFTTKQTHAAEMIERYVRIGDGWQKRSSVTRRPRISACRFRTDAQAAAFINSRNRSPAGADRVNVHNGNRDRQSRHSRFVCHAQPIAIAERHVG